MQLFDRNRRGPKIGGSAPFWGGMGWVPIYHRVAWGDAYLRTKWHLDASSRLPFFLGAGGSWVPIEHKVSWAEENLHTK